MKLSAGLLLVSSLILSTHVFAQTKCFVAKENGQFLKQEGKCAERHSPYSTFKMAISLMGYNEGILIDETHPQWPFKPGYVDWRESWKQPQNPTTWIKNSVVWYSQLITTTIGVDKFKQYVSNFNYGNKNVSGDPEKNNGLTNAWLGSSLEISGLEQVDFIKRFTEGSLPVSEHAVKMTKNILFVEALPKGWKLYGKTGTGHTLIGEKEYPMGWFVGWLEKDNRKIYFANYIEEDLSADANSGARAQEMAKEKLLLLISSK